MTVRTRFAPSPTGHLHIGGARTALFNTLFAMKNKGVFVLRFEDTDVVRSEVRFAELQEADMEWLGIEWQEGPGANGAYGPYWQSQRQPIYDRYYKKLEEMQCVYPCFCTDQELNLARKLQLSRGIPPKYSGKCRNLSKEEVDKRIADGQGYVLRFIVPAHQIIEFKDLIRGQQSFKSDDIGDFIVRRANGTPPFLFCNAIDDAEMKITHVLRGEDHVANTPRQIMLFQVLNLPVPMYGHLSLIVGDDGAPLSKRHGSFGLDAMRQQGYLPLAIVNYLARLGHSFDAQELLSLQKLSMYFNTDKLSRSPARFDNSQLMYWQKLAVLALDTENLWHWLGEEVADLVPDEAETLFAETIKANIEFPKDAHMWAKIFFEDDLHMDEDAIQIINQAGEQFFVEAEQAVERYSMDLQAILDDMKKTLNLGGKKLFMPLRVALTGKTYGPELVQIVALLGPAKMQQRLGKAFQLASQKS